MCPLASHAERIDVLASVTRTLDNRAGPSTMLNRGVMGVGLPRRQPDGADIHGPYLGRQASELLCHDGYCLIGIALMLAVVSASSPEPEPQRSPLVRYFDRPGISGTLCFPAARVKALNRLCVINPLPPLPFQL
jgi:hypothetical protein